MIEWSFSSSLFSLPHTFFQKAKDSCPEKRRTTTERHLMEMITNNNQRINTEVTEESDETDKIN